jgi:hypothetical protein
MEGLCAGNPPLILRNHGIPRVILPEDRDPGICAAMRGEGFMSYKAAEVLLRRVLIPMLANGGTIGPRSLFAEIFRH